MSINLSLCDENLISCEQVSYDDPRLSHTCHFSLYNSEQTCTQIVKKAKYNIYHNGTQGLTEIHLQLNLTNVTFYITDDNEQYEQFFEVNFLWYNHQQNFTNLLSGNPGYIIGKPILVANVNCSTLNKTKDRTTFDFIVNDHNVSDNFLVIPANINGYCTLNNNIYRFINFGYNSRFGCKKNILIENMKNETITKEICLYMQEKIFNLWQISLTNESFKYVATYGNSNRSQVEEWVQIMYDFNINETLDKIAFVHDYQDEILCLNLVNNLKINILYSNVDLDGVKNQRKILNVYIQLNTKDVTKFMIEDKNQYSFDIKIFTEVMFYDVTTPKIRKFVDPPSLEVKLPQDFFYPFMSKQSVLIQNIFIMILGFTLVYILSI